MHQRIARIKASTVRVLANGSAGSGFIVRHDGLIATCFHVVQKVTRPPPNTVGILQPSVDYQPNITVEIPNFGLVPAIVHPVCKNQGMQTAMLNDFVILKVAASNLPALPISSLADVNEGADVYLCGHPLGIEQQIVARGMVSTKFLSPSGFDRTRGRDSAWLDITQNSGNSGGPVMTFEADPAQDKVIAIATFGLNPYAHPATAIAQMAASFRGNVHLLGGIDMKQFIILIGQALTTNSIGVSGCVSAEYLAAALATVP